MNVIWTCIYRKQLLLFLLLCCTQLSFTFSFAQISIVQENALPGNTDWGVNFDFKDERICGFATKMSVNKGEMVDFKINVPSGTFHGEIYPGGVDYNLKIYRIGYYNGAGARLITDMGNFTGIIQEAPIQDMATGHIDCSNWDVSVSWQVPSDAVSGLYIAKLQRFDYQGPITGVGANHIVFIVRNDVAPGEVVNPATNSGSDILLQFPDATWQAYNTYGGNSLYNGTTSRPPYGQAAKVSYNRPFFINAAGFSTSTKISDWYMNCEYPMIRWLERNGYDVTYTTNVDAASRPEQLLYHKIFISLGHDEYWSKEQRDNVTAARNAGVHLAFFSGNEVYWKTRWEDNYRTLVCYKEGIVESGMPERECGNCDPTNIWTGLWRIGSASYGGAPDNLTGNPENELTGQISWYETTQALEVPAYYKNLRFWRNTSVSSLSTGQTATLAPGLLGYEWDWEQHPDSYPRGRIRMSSTTASGKTHKLSLYRHSSGALVFGAGTVQWSWGLDNNHFDNTASAVSLAIQQATVNLFADMGVQPASLFTGDGLTTATQSNDLTPPTSIITSLPGDPITTGSTVNLSGTSSDAGGGVVAGIEVSIDGGITWKVANSSDPAVNITWDYSFTAPAGLQSSDILVRGFDDSGNMETISNTVTISVSLQGRPSPPNAQWQVPLQIDFYQNGNIVFSYTPTTDQDGSVTINNVPTGNYTIAIKNSHTLKRVKANEAIVAGSNNVVFNELIEGDVNNNNIVNLADLGALLSSYNKVPGDSGYLAEADLNGNGIVNLADLGLLLANYNTAGEVP
jgi:hypothetical protein